MELYVIKSDQQYEQYLDWVDEMFDKGIKLDSPQGKKVEVCLVLIKDYEDKNFPHQKFEKREVRLFNITFIFS